MATRSVLPPCGLAAPHVGHLFGDERIWCPGARFSECGKREHHDPHFVGEHNDEVCLGGEPYGRTQEEFAQESGSVRLPVDPAAERTAQVLTDWWIDLAQEEVQKVAPKAVEYGSTDLIEIGRDLASMMGWRGLSDEMLAEVGIYFYLVGKMARWRDAIHRQDRVSDDTLHDIGVYVRMAQRVRAVGGWPFAPEDGESR